MVSMVANRIIVVIFKLNFTNSCICSNLVSINVNQHNSLQMRFLKLILGVVMMIIGLCSCKSTQPIRQAERTLKGNWTLTNVSYSRPGKFNVKLYNDAGSDCFQNSTWTFVPNNNTGTYQFTNSGCDTTLKNVKWTIPIPDGDSYSFMMKPLTAKKKSIEGNKGFRTGLQMLTENTMVWSQKLQFEGQPFVITMNFSKNQ